MEKLTIMSDQASKKTPVKLTLSGLPNAAKAACSYAGEGCPA